MFQCKVDEIFSDMPNVFGIADDVLVIGYDNNGSDHDTVVHKVLQRCRGQPKIKQREMPF